MSIYVYIYYIVPMIRKDILTVLFDIIHLAERMTMPN